MNQAVNWKEKQAEMDRDLNVIGTLKHARRLIDKGWCQLAEKRKTEAGMEYCAWGAIKRTTSNMGRSVRSRIIIEQHVIDDANLLKFNDKPFRTKEEILDVFGRAIDWVTQELLEAEMIADNTSSAGDPVS